MTLEIERKFAVADLAEIAGRLVSLGMQHGETVDQADTYYAHPARDFAATDEALRIRRVGRQNYLTYKGPKLDRVTKTRREIELCFESGEPAADQLAEMLTALGFSAVATVHKRRRLGTLRWQNHDVQVALDSVQDVGTFIEIEIIAEEADAEPAKAALATLADALDLAGGEQRSYLEMLLGSRQ